MTIAVPIEGTGRGVAGFVLAILNATWLSEATDKIGYGPNGKVFLVWNWGDENVAE